jgi:hypothetical protein
MRYSSRRTFYLKGMELKKSPTKRYHENFSATKIFRLTVFLFRLNVSLIPHDFAKSMQPAFLSKAIFRSQERINLKPQIPFETRGFLRFSSRDGRWPPCHKQHFYQADQRPGLSWNSALCESPVVIRYFCEMNPSASRGSMKREVDLCLFGLFNR